MAFWDRPISVIEEYMNHRKIKGRVYEIIEQSAKELQSPTTLQFANNDLFSQIINLTAQIVTAEKHIDEEIHKHTTDNTKR